MGCFHSKTTNFGDIALWWILSQWGLEGAGPGAGVQGDDLESMETIVSESGEKAPNVVYRGKFEGGWLVAVKRFSKQSWPDAQQFVAEAVGVGKLRHNNISSTDGDPRLSSFGLIKNIRDGKSYSTNLAYTPPEFMRTVGSIFLLVISYKREKHFEARDRPNSKFLLSAVEPLQTQKEVASHVTRMKKVQKMSFLFKNRLNNAIEYYSKLVAMMSVPSATVSLGSHEQESINLIEAIGGEVELRPPTVDVDAEKGTSRCIIIHDLEGKND
ncbi:hypothetical protein OPV22_018113 [Ensete ventricosum]|uniref:Serine-threonine/tyrosine-protein kinase catalytic domain-containing protein n=1 Tax=Ensete ventricosum TaxID=4639 RepID=A0AAV8R3S1_ENSVE|nr:hypothetical protein OPV22_018113 [Ensete ventricosum]